MGCVFFQTAAVMYCFGGNKFYDCIEQMIGFRVGKIWYWCWMVISPCFMAFLFIFYFVKYEPIKYAKTYEYPFWRGPRIHDQQLFHDLGAGVRHLLPPHHGGFAEGAA